VPETRCACVRQAISARLDGEASASDLGVDEHVVRCADCAQFAERALRLHRRMRLHVVGDVPDLRAEILASAVVTVPAGGFAGRLEQLVTLARTRWRPAARWSALVVPLGATVPVLAFGVLDHAHVLATHHATPCTAHLLRATQLVRVHRVGARRG